MIAHGELGGDLRSVVGVHSVSRDGVTWSACEPPPPSFVLLL